MSTALVTGAAGFVGRHFAARLRELSWDVCAVDTAYAKELTDRVDVREFFSWCEESYDLVLHCAAVVGGRQVIEHQPLAQAVNLELDAAMFRWALRTRPGRVVYFSSSAAYPMVLQQASNAIRHRLTESDLDPSLAGPSVRPPDQLYGWAKLTGENLARLAQDEGLSVTVVRPFSGYGEDQDDCYPFPAFVDRALRRDDPFLIWGTGGQVRDFIHVDDIVETTLELVQLGHNGPVNLGWGEGTSMRELARQVCSQAGYSPGFETVPSAPSGAFYRVCDPARMNRIRLPKVSLEEGIRRALEYRGASIVRA